MVKEDRCCSIAPYFRVMRGKLEAFKEVCAKLVEKSQAEPKCLYYGFSFDGEEVHCREGYEDAEGALAHLDNIGSLLEQAFQLSALTRLEIHGPRDELIKLWEPFALLKPKFFFLECGFRR